MCLDNVEIIGQDISLSYIFYEQCGYFASATVAKWVGIEKLPNWNHSTILDLLAIDFLNDSEAAQNYMLYFKLHGTYTAKRNIEHFDVSPQTSLGTYNGIIEAQKIIFPAFIPGL